MGALKSQLFRAQSEIVRNKGVSAMRNTFMVVVLLIGATAIGFAQVDTGGLVGIVKDSSGAALSNVSVTATNVDTGIPTAVKTNPEGNYVIAPLQIGRYSLSVESTGFRKEVRKDIVLNVQQTMRVDFRLQVGSVSETMEVSGETPLLETESASLGDVVTSQQVELLPLNGRRYTDLAELTSGVSKVIEGPVNGGSSPTNGNAGGSFAVNGMRGVQNNFMLDGIDNNSNDNGDVAILSSVDAIAEFKIQTSNYSPEFGRSGGAVINASTKSGTNKFHGSAWEFLRNDALIPRNTGSALLSLKRLTSRISSELRSVGQSSRKKYSSLAITRAREFDLHRPIS